MSRGEGPGALARGLSWIVAVTIFLQLATARIPGLRTMLGLHPLDLTAFALIAAALAVSVLGANYSAHHTSEAS